LRYKSEIGEEQAPTRLTETVPGVGACGGLLGLAWGLSAKHLIERAAPRSATLRSTSLKSAALERLATLRPQPPHLV